MRWNWVRFCIGPAGRVFLVIVCAGMGIAPVPVYAQNNEPPPFVDDPAVIGTWYAVDFVPSIEEFIPGQRFWKEDLYLADITFETGGAASGWWRWSKGYAWDSREKNLCSYAFKNIGGTEYLFFEWVNGDVTRRGQKPFYYVLVRGAAKDISSPDLRNIGLLLNVGCGILYILISIPLVFGKIPRNGLYGFRIPKAYLSDAFWYEINAYGGKQMILWSAIMIAVNIAAFFILKAPWEQPTFLAMSIGPFVVFPTCAVIVTLIHAARLQP